MGADGALRTVVDAWYMPLPGTGRARLAVSAVVSLAALIAAMHFSRDGQAGIRPVKKQLIAS